MAVMMNQLLDSSEWTVDTLLKNMECGTCLDEIYNDWMICHRKNSELNLHPEYLSRPRQSWYLSIFPLKWLEIPSNYNGPIVDFAGLLKPKVRTLFLKNPALPTKSRKTAMITYGECILIIYLVKTAFHFFKGKTPL